MRKVLIYVVMMMLLCTSLVAQNDRTQVVAPNNLSWQKVAGRIQLDWTHGFHEDFSDGSAQNFEFSHPTKFSVINSNLRMLSTSTSPNRNTWASAYYDENFDNFELEFRFRRNQSTATQENSIGVLVRSQYGHMNNTPTDLVNQIQGASGYLITVKATGAYSFWKMTEGVATMIKTWTTSNFINTGLGNPNVIRVDATGDLIKLYINGYFVDQFIDATYADGKIVLCTYDSNAGNNEILWHYVKVTPIQMIRSYARGISNTAYPLATEDSNPEYSNLPAISNPYIELRDAPSAVSYDIYRNNVLHDNTAVRTYTEADLYQNQNFEYYVVAKYFQGEDAEPEYLYSAASNVVYVEHFEPVPAGSVIVTSTSGYNVDVEWGQPQGPAFEACTGYKVFLNNETNARATITDKEITEASISAPAGTHTVSVVATYTRGDSDEVESDEFFVHNFQPVQNVETTVDGLEITFTFDAPTGNPLPAPFEYRLYEVIGWIAHERDTLEIYEDLEFIYDDIETPGIYNFRISALYENFVLEGNPTYYTVDTNFSVTVDNVRPVENLEVTAIGQTLNFTWDAPVVVNPGDFAPNPTGYRIRVSQAGPGEIFEETVANTVFEFTREDLDFGNYQYFVYADYTNGNSGQSAFINVYNPLSVVNADADQTIQDQVEISWDHPLPAGCEGVRVFRQLASRAFVELEGEIVTDNGTQYIIDENTDDNENLIYGERTYKIVAVYPNYPENLYTDNIAPEDANVVTINFTVNMRYPAPKNIECEVNYSLVQDTWNQDVVLTWEAPDPTEEPVEFNHYAIYRVGENAEGEPVDNLITTTTAITVTILNQPLGSNTYKVSAVYDDENDDEDPIEGESARVQIVCEIESLFPAPRPLVNEDDLNIVVENTNYGEGTYDLRFRWRTPVLPQNFDFTFVRYEIRTHGIDRTPEGQIVATITNFNTITHVLNDVPVFVDEQELDYWIYAVYNNNRRSSPLDGSITLDTVTDNKPVENLVLAEIDTKTVTLKWEFPVSETEDRLSGFYIYRDGDNLSNYLVGWGLLNDDQDAFDSEGFVDENAELVIDEEDGFVSFEETVVNYGTYTYRVVAIYDYVAADEEAEPVVEESFVASSSKSVVVNVEQYPQTRYINHVFNGNHVVVYWDEPWNNDELNDALTGFNLYRRVGNGQNVHLNPNALISVESIMQVRDLEAFGNETPLPFYVYVDESAPLGNLTYSVEMVYTTEQSVRTEETVVNDTFYKATWTGNGFYHMNFYITEAFINGSALQAGDEIAIYNTADVLGHGFEWCVGAYTIPQNLSGQQTFGFNLHIPVSLGNIEYTMAHEGDYLFVNGFIENIGLIAIEDSGIKFKVYRNGVEFDEIAAYIRDHNDETKVETFAVGQTAFVRLGDMYLNQTTPLTHGWNIISSRVVPENRTIPSVFGELRDNGSLMRMLAQEGLHYNFWDEWAWDYEEADESEVLFKANQSYRVRVTANDNFNISGMSVFYDQYLNGSQINPELDPDAEDYDNEDGHWGFHNEVVSGWNLISYPYSVAIDPLPLLSEQELLYQLVDATSPTGVRWLGPIRKIMDQHGNIIQPVNNNTQLINSIGTFKPGQGYVVYVDNNVTINYPLLLGDIETRSNEIPVVLAPSYFAKNWSGNGWMHFNLTVAVDEYITSTLSVGDEIAIFDGENCVGVTVYNGQTDYINVVASLNEDLDGVINGYNPANPFSVKIWFANSNTVVDAPSYQITQGSNLFEVNGTSVVQFSDFTSEVSEVLPSVTDISAIYPNPFNPTTNIRFSNRVAGNVSLEVYNVKGQKVKTLASGHHEAGHYQVTWNGDDSNGRKVGSGVYFTRLVTEDKQVIKKMVLVK